jgi:D-arabinose 1-dehydrogenase-like Zn-dependent alcohol dehydrogenase
LVYVTVKLSKPSPPAFQSKEPPKNPKCYPKTAKMVAMMLIIYFVFQLPMPTLDENSVLVQVKACGLSLVNGKVLSSLFKKAPRSQHPVGHEVAGIVTHIGDAVSSLKPGDDVVGMC